MSEPAVGKLTLGQVSINRDAFELDLKINENYQAFSAELLRLDLFVLTGLSALWLKLFMPKDPVPVSRHSLGLLLLLVSICTVLSAGAALIHRYTSSDSLAYHLAALRLRARNRSVEGSKPSDLDFAAKEERQRNIRFRLSLRLLQSSGLLLFIALLLFCIVLARFMF